MKTPRFLFIASLATCIFATSCRELFEEAGQSTLRIVFNGDRLSFTKTGTNVPDTDDFLVKVTGSDGEVVYDGRYGSSPEVFTVPAGSYTVTAASESFKAPDYDKPIFGDTRVIVVESGGSATAELCCRQTNCGLKLTVDDRFRTAFPEGTLYLNGNDGKLEYPYGEQRTGFFKPGTISITLQDAGSDQTLFSRTLEAQQILNVAVSAADGAGSAEGGGGISLEVDTVRTWLDDNYIYGKTGGGSIEEAYSINEARDHIGQTDVWVCGYIVGIATNTSKFSFAAPFDKDSNILLGLRDNTSKGAYCLTVELKSGPFREALNLRDSPSLLGRQVYLRGDLVRAYYGIPGLKALTEYQFK